METLLKYRAIGLMSGTSLDGLDICCVDFILNDNQWSFNLVNAETYKYEAIYEDRLRSAVNLSAEDLLALNADYGFYLGNKTQQFIKENNITEVDVIASHGHTIFHQPEKKFTLQIGDGRAIQQITELDVVYDFRSQDVILGGHGAPLVPIGDHFLFSKYDACLNLGGFSNISLVKNNNRIAFDVCPVNIILNALSKELGFEYDKDGKIARKGKINKDLLLQLNALEFYTLSHPKSLGIEWVKQNINPLLTNDTAENLIATVTEHAAEQIANILNQYQLKNVLFTGGGSYNSYLIEKIKAKTKTNIIIPEENLINYKEALIFAFMGLLKKLNLNNVLCSATGSTKDHSSGLYLKF